MNLVAKVNNGKVTLHDAANGILKRHITVNSTYGKAVSAVLQGDLVSVTTDKGKVVIHDAKNGIFKRVI